jgi:outer membrane protein OmpA-like peptidoglycan-associated protein
MFASLPSRAIGAAALAGALLISGCSSESDVPPVVASSPDGGTQMNTDTGSGGTFPDVNTVPTTRPTSTIQDLIKLPDGLSGAQNGTQYGEPLVGGPSSAADRPAPPPPPVEELPPIPEPDGEETQGSEVPEASAPDDVAEAPANEAASEEPAATEAAPEPEVAQPEMPDQPIAAAAPAPEASQPEADAAQYGDFQPAPEGESEAATAAEIQPESQPAATPEAESPPLQPETQLAMVPPPAVAQPQAPAVTQPTEQPFYSAQALYRSPYATSQAQPAAPAPTNAAYGTAPAAGQPLALIYFDSGSSNLSADDRNVLRQIAELQRTQGGIVHIIGHASLRSDSTDPEHQQINQDISEARAGIVAQQLMEYGVPQDAITTVAAGDSQPLYSDSGEAGNRRAEVYLSAN